MQPTLSTPPVSRLPESIGDYFPDATGAQAPAQIGVCIGTVLRPCLVEAIRSIFRQSFQGRIQILIGVDKATGPVEPINAVLAERPEHVSALLLSLPYSTSVRHGGVHTAMDGGAIRTLLSFLANARYVAYLDDDNTYETDHLSGLFEAVQGKVWAYAQRMLVDQNGVELAVDRWDSVGVGRGRFKSQGGFVDTNCLLIDKVAAARAFGRWSESGTGQPGFTADRNFFAGIREAPHARVERASVRYMIRPENVMNTFLRDGVEF